MTLLDVTDVTVAFPGRKTLFGPGDSITAVRGVSISITEGETLGLLGESGSGKSTLARAILGLVPIQSGSVTLMGRSLTEMSQREMRALRPSMQAVFQDPYSSLNPALRVFDIVAEPLRQYRSLTSHQLHGQVRELLERVGLDPAHEGRFPEQFSGGQRQRIAIARAIALNPRLIIADEVTSGLDASTRGQILNLFEDLQSDLGVAYLFIGHDVAVVRHVSHRIAVMNRGTLVEEGSADEICDAPTQTYTRRLMEAVPVPDPSEQQARRRRRLAVMNHSRLDSPFVSDGVPAVNGQWHKEA